MSFIHPCNKVKEEQDRLAIISSNQQQPYELEKEAGSIYSAIAAANDKYGAPGPDSDVGSGDKDPVDPGIAVPIPTGYGVPQAEPLRVYRPASQRARRGRRRKNNFFQKYH